MRCRPKPRPTPSAPPNTVSAARSTPTAFSATRTASSTRKNRTVFATPTRSPIDSCGEAMMRRVASEPRYAAPTVNSRIVTTARSASSSEKRDLPSGIAIESRNCVTGPIQPSRYSATMAQIVQEIRCSEAASSGPGSSTRLASSASSRIPASANASTAALSTIPYGRPRSRSSASAGRQARPSSVGSARRSTAAPSVAPGAATSSFSLSPRSNRRCRARVASQAAATAIASARTCHQGSGDCNALSSLSRALPSVAAKSVIGASCARS